VTGLTYDEFEEMRKLFPLPNPAQLRFWARGQAALVTYRQVLTNHAASRFLRQNHYDLPRPRSVPQG
jgi:hypothetical protein